MSHSPIIIALDYTNHIDATRLVDKINPEHCHLKIGHALFTSAGPALVRTYVKAGFKVFLDLKFHDIPNTVYDACSAAADLGVWMLNVHTLGGARMLEAAVKSLNNFSGSDKPIILGVTLLTSMTYEDMQEVGLKHNQDELSQVVILSNLAKNCGLDGVVCSPHEVRELRAGLGDDFILVTPGIRPEGVTQDDQKRIMNPRAAIKAGSDYIVIGRPITKSVDPVVSLNKILLDIEGIHQR